VSDASVRAALRSDEMLVVIEAPAGCGKTHQGADYALEMAGTSKGRLLILTHTHAACSVFAERTRGVGSLVEIRTIDSLISQVANAYHVGLGLPQDATAWARRTKDGYAHLAVKVATFVNHHPMVAALLARRYPVVVCDEHQDSSGDQHALTMALHRQGARLRVFADPMQRIYKDTPLPGGQPRADWASLARSAGAFERLDTPHRWRDGCAELGAWTLEARRILKAGGRIDLGGKLPRGVEVVLAHNQARRYNDFQLAAADRRKIDAFERGHDSLLIVSHFAQTAQNLRAFFGRRVPLWEGHTRPALERLIEATRAQQGKPEALAAALVRFMGEIGKGFSPSAFGDRLVCEAAEGCTRPTSGKLAAIQALARYIVDAPDHRGVAGALRSLAELRRTHPNFFDIELDCHVEFWEAVRLGDHANPDEGFAHIAHHRMHSRPKVPPKAISTIHKAKGLECDGVIVMPCDAKTFPDSSEARCLLYVALSRAKKRFC
jgi:hypothetical protein